MKERFDKFTSLILNISRCIQKIKNVEMENLGLKGKQVQCLFHLYNCQGASATDLSKMCGEDKGAMSRTVKELVSGGLVYVDEGEDKKYRNLIKLTEKGKEAARLVSEKIYGMFEIGSEGISENERNTLYRLLEQISDNLNTMCEKYRG